MNIAGCGKKNRQRQSRAGWVWNQPNMRCGYAMFLGCAKKIGSVHPQSGQNCPFEGRKKPDSRHLQKKVIYKAHHGLILHERYVWSGPENQSVRQCDRDPISAVICEKNCKPAYGQGKRISRPKYQGI